MSDSKAEYPLPDIQRLQQALDALAVMQEHFTMDTIERYYMDLLPPGTKPPLRGISVGGGIDGNISFMFEADGRFIGVLSTDCNSFYPVFEPRMTG